MIENTHNRQFLSCRWSQYLFLMVFMMVYINSCTLLVCQINIYWDSTHIDVNWRQFNVENDRKWSKIHNIVNFCHVDVHNTSFQWLLWWFISIPALCSCVRSIFIEIALIMSKMIENTQNRQFLSYKWPHYQFSMVLMLVHIDIFSLFVVKMITFSNINHLEVNWRPF